MEVAALCFLERIARKHTFLLYPNALFALTIITSLDTFIACYSISGDACMHGELHTPSDSELFSFLLVSHPNIVERSGIRKSHTDRQGLSHYQIREIMVQLCMDQIYTYTYIQTYTHTYIYTVNTKILVGD